MDKGSRIEIYNQVWTGHQADIFALAIVILIFLCGVFAGYHLGHKQGMKDNTPIGRLDRAISRLESERDARYGR